MFSPRKSHWFPAWLTLAALVCFFAGCQTVGTFPSPGPDWQTYQGQLRYTSAKGKSVIGDVVIRRSPHDDFQLEFQSGPGFPLMRVWESGGLARVEGILSHGTWQGPVDHAPRGVQSWLGLRRSFATPPGSKKVSLEVAGDRFNFAFSK